MQLFLERMALLKTSIGITKIEVTQKVQSLLLIQKMTHIFYDEIKTILWFTINDKTNQLVNSAVLNLLKNSHYISMQHFLS